VIPPRYNIAPTQPVVAVRQADETRELVPLRWGLVPSWVKEPGGAQAPINARAETLLEKPFFRSAFRQRRCLIPGSGFYEWKNTGERVKQPYLLRRRDGQLLAFAGLWERWDPSGAEPVESCAVVTTEANATVRFVHDRMPVLIEPDAFTAWLDPQTPVQQLLTVLRPCPAEEIVVVPVGRYVSNPRNEGPRCLAS
jgi:putative SOS response-associated peptidase YedK